MYSPGSPPTFVPTPAPGGNAPGGVPMMLIGRVALIVDDGACQEGVESTIVAGRTLLRPGPVTLEMLGRVVPVTPGATTHVSAPGQLALHYAPSKPVRLNALRAEKDEYLIGFGLMLLGLLAAASGPDPEEPDALRRALSPIGPALLALALSAADAAGASVDMSASYPKSR